MLRKPGRRRVTVLAVRCRNHITLRIKGRLIFVSLPFRIIGAPLFIGVDNIHHGYKEKQSCVA